MMIKRYLLISLLVCVFTVSYTELASQFTPASVEVSQVKAVLNGKTFYLHTVKENQTLFSIARKYEVPTIAIIEANPEHPALETVLSIGQVIKIPVKDQNGALVPNIQEKSSAKTSLEPKTDNLFDYSQPISVEKSEIEKLINGKRYYIHIVKPGQTLFSIARAYRVSTLIIAESNPHYPDILKGINIDQEILIPKTEMAPPPAAPVSEETLWPIGLLNDPSVSFLPKDCREPELKRSYNVALLIPLFLDRFSGTSSSISGGHPSFTFLPYYQGVLLALDSARNNGANINLHVFDLERETSRAYELIQKPEMAQMDLIIGPFYQETLHIVAPFAKDYGISVVSPLLPNNDQLINNPNLFQTVPSTKNQLLKLAEFLKNQYQGQNIILVHNNVAETLPLIEDFKYAMHTQTPLAEKSHESIGGGGDFIHGYFLNGSFIGASRSEHPPVIQEAFYQFPAGISLKEIILGTPGVTVSRIANSLERNKKNVVVSLVGNEVIVSNMMRDLNRVSSKNFTNSGPYNITLIGPARWEEFQSIDMRLFESLNVHILSTDFVDYSQLHIRNFVKKFREVFNDEPNSYAFWGAQSAFFFFMALDQYGKNFGNCIEAINRDFNPPNMAFERFYSKNNGWVNSNLIIYRINDFQRKCVLESF